VTDESLPELRASDAEREQYAEILRRAGAEGRLTVDELEERLDRVYESRTHGELEKLVVDVVPRGNALGLPNLQTRVPVRKGESGPGWLVSIMSGRERKGRWRVGPTLRVVNIMGATDLDLNDAEFADDHVYITVFSLMGGSDIRVPEGLNVEFSEFAFMGANDSKLGDEHPDPGGPVLHLRMISIMGGTDVKRGRKLSRAERRAKKRLEREGGR
jgi:hypothetical protein